MEGRRILERAAAANAGIFGAVGIAVRNEPKLVLTDGPSLERTHGLLPAVCLALALMVFLWGTAYKLSLYNTAGARGSAPAKLCTRTTDVAKVSLQKAVAPPRSEQLHHTVAALLALPALSVPLHTSRRHAGETPRPRMLLARCPQCSLRPPPSPVFANV